MFSPVQIKQEYPVVDESNQSIANGIQATAEYPIFTNQDVEYMYRQLPQFWAPAQVQSQIQHQMVHEMASKEEGHIRQQMSQSQQPVQHLAVTNYLQQQSHVMPFPVEQRNSHEPENLQQTQMTQPPQQPNLTHVTPESHGSQLVLQHPLPNPSTSVLLAAQTASPSKHNGPGRPPKPSATTGPSPPKKTKCQCEICFKEFGHKSNLFIHMRTHNGERPYKCTQCDKCFTHSGNLAIHMRTHSGERPYACQICGKMFSHSGNLSTHLRTHSGVKPYKCPVCGKEFRHSGNLSIHERIHSGIKPFQCKVCGKEFYHSGNLTTHMKKHPIDKNSESSPIPITIACDPNDAGRIGTIACDPNDAGRIGTIACDPNDAGRIGTIACVPNDAGRIGTIACDPNDAGRIGTENSSNPNNPVSLAVNVAPTGNRGIAPGNSEDPKSVKNEMGKDVAEEESLRFSPPTS